MSDIIGNDTNIRIAQQLGKLRVTHSDGNVYYDGEDYEHDLNAMHVLEMVMDDKTLALYRENLKRICHGDITFSNEEALRHNPVHASADHRAKAFLETMGA